MDQIEQKNDKMVVDKYDRQIRLWGPRGQRYLGQAKIALVKCTGAGIQALKNLILPGVGTADIYDTQRIKVQDLASSFFYEHDQVGKHKGQIASRNLLQMNEDSNGSFFQKTIQQFLNNQQLIKTYKLVIFGGQMTQQQTKKASEVLWRLNIPCIFITIAGYFFYIRLQKHFHFVQSSNTGAKKFYLRISDPFPELYQYAKNNCIYRALQNLKNKSPQVPQQKQDFLAFSHIPSVLILISVYDNLPKQKRYRADVLSQLNSLLQKANPFYRKNIRQAIQGYNNVFQTPDNFMKSLDLLHDKNVNQSTKDSHIMLKFLWATQKFLAQTSNLPQPTLLPDMDTTTQRYIKLKNIYKQKHKNDIQNIIRRIKQKFGSQQQIQQNIISEYINNLYNLQLVQMRPYYEQLDRPDPNAFYCFDQKQKDMLLSMLLSIRAYQTIYTQHFSQQSYQKLQQIVRKLQLKYQIKQFDQRYLEEIHRSKGLSNINIYSIAGAMAAQQGIKLITGCFTPMNSGYFFDGANGTGYQVKL